MNRDRHAEISDLFRRVCDLGAHERGIVLDRVGREDPELRASVEVLLALDEVKHDAFDDGQLGVGHVLLALDDAAAKTAGPTPGGARASPHGRFPPGAMVGDRFRVVSLLGRGGMGEVYRADDLKLGQAVALKFLPAELSRNEHLLQLFHNEARLSRQIAHPSVCRVYDIGEIAGQHFLSMEYVDGEDLRQLLRRIGRLPREKGIDLARQICSGLAAAHERGVLHRDLKPANVMIDGHGRARITDFGMARLVETPSTPGERSGTLAYMAPEQLAGGETTVQSDLYSLGLVLHEMFTGEVVHKNRTAEDIRDPRSKATPFDPQKALEDVDPEVARVILSCLEAEPNHRPRSARAVAAALPGGAALELAIAAGETPSPEMIVAAGEGKGLSQRFGAACVIATLVGVIGAGLLTRRAQNNVGLDAARLVQPDAAQELIRTLGLESEDGDRTWGLGWNQAYFDVFEDDESARDEWGRVTGEPPSAAVFWYRQHEDDLVPKQGRGPYLSLVVTRDDPPPNEPGMVSVLLDARGKLLELAAPPGQGAAGAPEGEWLDALLCAAGIEPTRFRDDFSPSTRNHGPPTVFGDTWRAFDSRSGRMRIEAAAFEARPVYFRINAQREGAPLPSRPAVGVILSLTVLTLFAVSLVLARRNWKSGRADRRGSLRLLLFIVFASALSWLVRAHHVTGTGELGMILGTVARALLRAVLICAAYVGLEPHVRKLWPQTLVSWSRLLAGRIHDPIIGRDLLLGVCGGVILQLLGSLGLVFGIRRQWSLTADPVLRLGVGPFSLEPLLGPGVALGNVVQDLVVGVVAGLVACMLFVFVLRIVLRKSWLAMAVFVLFFSAPTIRQGEWMAAIIVALWSATALFLLFRFGVLTVAAAWLSWRVLSWPMDFDMSSPHVDLGVLARAALVTLACYAFYSATRVNDHKRSDRGMRTPSESIG